MKTKNRKVSSFEKLRRRKTELIRSAERFDNHWEYLQYLRENQDGIPITHYRF